MKISVCIPIFNFDVTSLVSDLKFEIHTDAIDAEIILIDDASEEKFRKINHHVISDTCNYIQLGENIGRSKIRNLFLKYAKGEYLLFLDCDCKIISANFLKNYLKFLTENIAANVVYGGRTLAKEKPDAQYLLRWKYAEERENLEAAERSKAPWMSFQTNNFLIKKEVFSCYLFDEDFNKYGYEDLLFALNLKAAGIKISHFENPVLNIDLETNKRYLLKVEEAISTLSKMLESKKSAKVVYGIKAAKAYFYLDKFYLNKAFLLIFKLMKNKLRSSLLSNPKSLRTLDFYKLGLLCEQMKK